MSVDRIFFFMCASCYASVPWFPCMCYRASNTHLYGLLQSKACFISNTRQRIHGNQGCLISYARRESVSTCTRCRGEVEVEVGGWGEEGGKVGRREGGKERVRERERERKIWGQIRRSGYATSSSRENDR